jgi:hypothetical protein
MKYNFQLLPMGRAELIKRIDKLKKGIPPVLREIDGFLYCTGVLTTSLETPGEDIVRNCIRNSFLMHYRNLYYFFNNYICNDDIIVGHYSPADFTIENASANIREVNRFLAHLTYARVGREVSWDIDAMTADILPKCREFILFLEVSGFDVSGYRAKLAEQRKKIEQMLAAEQVAV